jgi:hypothetical protein
MEDIFTLVSELLSGMKDQGIVKINNISIDDYQNLIQIDNGKYNNIKLNLFVYINEYIVYGVFTTV